RGNSFCPLSVSLRACIGYLGYPFEKMCRGGHFPVLFRSRDPASREQDGCSLCCFLLCFRTDILSSQYRWNSSSTPTFSPQLPATRKARWRIWSYVDTYRLRRAGFDPPRFHRLKKSQAALNGIQSLLSRCLFWVIGTNRLIKCVNPLCRNTLR